MTDDILTLAQAAELCGLSPATLRRYMPGEKSWKPVMSAAFKLGKTWLIRQADFDQWLADYRAAPKLGRRGDGSVRRRARKA